MADGKLLSALRKLDTATLLYVGSNAVKQAEACEASGSEQGRRWGLVWQAIGAVVNRVLLERSMTSGCNRSQPEPSAETRTADRPEGAAPSTSSGHSSSGSGGRGTPSLSGPLELAGSVSMGSHAGETQHDRASGPGTIAR